MTSLLDTSLGTDAGPGLRSSFKWSASPLVVSGLQRLFSESLNPVIVTLRFNLFTRMAIPIEQSPWNNFLVQCLACDNNSLKKQKTITNPQTKIKQNKKPRNCVGIWKHMKSSTLSLSPPPLQKLTLQAFIEGLLCVSSCSKDQENMSDCPSCPHLVSFLS